MKEVLIIANLFHASPRIPGLTRYLSEFGWQPVVLTPPIGEDPDSQFGPPNDFKRTIRVIETRGYTSAYGKKRLTSESYSRIRPFLKFLYKYYREIVHYPDSEKSWKPFALEAAGKLLQSEDVDAIISSSSPVTCHIVARELKQRHKTPWVADLRDLWTQNPNYVYGPIRKRFERILELKTLSEADALVTISDPLSEELGAMHGREVYTITSGFDPEKKSNKKPKLTSKFTITYTGQIYNGKQDPSKVLAAVNGLISDSFVHREDLEIGFYGSENELLSKEVEKYGLSDIVFQHGIIPRQSAFEKQRESQLLLLLNWEDPRQKGVYTGKIFEYLAAQRPILATGGFRDDVVEALLTETKSGEYCPAVEDVKKVLRRSYSEYKSTGKVAYCGDATRINQYSYREIAKKYSEILDDLVKERRHKA